MDLILHRGFNNALIKENSLDAFKVGLNDNNYIGIETDVRVTKDNVFVLYHDPLYKGKLVKNVLYKEMKQDNVCTLNDLLRIKTNKLLLLEIKDFDLDITNFINLLDKYNRNIYIMSFSTKVIEKLYKFKVNYKLGVLNYVINTPDEYIYDFICILNNLLSDYVINSYKTKGIEVIGYGVRNINLIKYKNIKYIVDNK